MIEKLLYRGSIFCVIALVLTSCLGRNKFDPDSYVRPLEIVKLSEDHYQYISYLKLKTI